MAKYLLDTNIILRFCNPADVQHRLVADAIADPYRTFANRNRRPYAQL